MNGKGEMKWKTGIKFEGQWGDGEALAGKHTDEHGTVRDVK